MSSHRKRMNWVAAATVACACVACNGPNFTWGGRRGASAEGAVSSNIIRVSNFISAAPWLIFNNDGSGRVDGVKMAVYLEPSHRVKGVFGTGTLLVEMYRLDRAPGGTEGPTLVQKWELPRERAYAWRAKRETALGWGYGLRLPWDNKLDLEGRRVVFVVKYIREDGRVISSSPQERTVPTRTGSRLEIT